MPDSFVTSQPLISLEPVEVETGAGTMKQYKNVSFMVLSDPHPSAHSPRKIRH